MKDTLEIRPIHHHLETRVRAHIFLCMLAYYVTFELAGRLTPMLFTDQTPLAPADPVAPAAALNSRQGQGRQRRDRGRVPRLTPSPTCSPTSAPSPATRSASADAEHTFTRLTKPTPLQASALELLDIKLAT